MKDFVPFEESLALKELGFDYDCFSYFRHDGTRGPIGWYYSYDQPKDFYAPQPTFSQAFRFFREKYDLFISIVHYENGYSINDLRRFSTYEEAEISCVIALINIVKKQSLKG
jgi:hypothetical protein